MEVTRNVAIVNMQAFFGSTFNFDGWQFEEADLEKFVEIEDADQIELINPARSRGKTTGEDVLRDLDGRLGVVLLGPEEFLAFMNDRDSIPKRWNNRDGDDEDEIVYIRFYRRILVSPDGERFVPAIFWYAGQFLPDIHNLDDVVDGTEKAAAIDENYVEDPEDIGDGKETPS